MKLPHTIESFENQSLRQRWITQFVHNGQHIAEGAWVRTQEEENREESKRRSREDKRMRIVYFRDEYDIQEEGNESHFLIKKPYLFLYYALPKKESSLLREKITLFLQEGAWNKVEENDTILRAERGDLVCEVRFSREVDKRSRIQDFPRDYRFTEMRVFSRQSSLTKEVDEKPWMILKKGIRKRDIPEKGKIIPVEEVLNFLPAHMEIGAGASVSSGVPALHTLHTIYSLKDKEGKFLFNPGEDTLLADVLLQPEVFYEKASRIHRKALTASPNRFYSLLQTLKEKKLLIEPVYVNNFDGFLSLIDVKSEYVRRIASTDIAEHIRFHPDAKSLIVVGVHADRRKIQRRAREAGLPVIYIDPEGFNENGDSFSYPLESIQKEDFHIPMRADDFAERLLKILEEKS